MKQALLKRCSFLLFTLMTVMSYAQNSNQVTVTGTVTDNVSGLLPGVNVTEKSTKNTVTTDFNGQFQIKVKPNATLVFSFIGMRKQEVPIGNRTTVNVKLTEDSNELQNIVVVGYGAQKKEKLTGAIATINPTEIQELPVSNLSEALRGQVPGLSIIDGGGRPGDQSSLEIRQTYGFSKDGSSKTPLIIIDDMIQVDPVNGRASMDAFNRLDPSEIESITVLKDASAAIYGSRAAQGAIVVKTKRGKSGVPTFQYFSQFAVNDAVSHSKTMSAYDFGVFSNRFFKGSNNLGTNGSNLFSDAELEQMKDLNYDWLREAWKPAIQQKHTLSVSGGTEKATYFAGINYFTQGANLGRQDYNKWNFRTGMTAKISSSLDFSAAVSGNSGDIEKSFTKASANISDSSYASAAGGEQADYGFLLHMPKYIPWQTTVGGQEYYVSPFARTDRNLGSANANNTIAGWNYFAAMNNGSKQTTNDFSYNVNMSLNYKVPFIKGLSIKGTYSRSQTSASTEQVQLPYDLARIRNYETQDNHLLSAANPTVYNASTNPDGDFLIETNARNSRVYYDTNFSKSVQANFFADYNRTFDNHEVGAMFSIERSESSYKSTRLAFENTGKDYGGSYQTAGTLSTNSTALKGEQGTLSYLGRLNYSYKSKYILQFLFRSDASTKFAPENYWGFFPSLQAGWIVSKEKWFNNNVSWVDFFKIRYSIGKVGNDNINAWRWMKLYDVIADKGFQFGSNGGVLGGGVTPRVEPNRNVGWDTTIKNNLGFDLTVLKNRLSITTDLYYDKSKEMLTGMAGAVGVPISVGGGFAEENYAAVDSWGGELAVNWKDNVNKDFSYNVGVNFGLSDNKVKKYPEPALLHPSNNLTEAGRSMFFPQWGFRTWKETSTGDGILRTDEDVANYWNYLTQRATAAGVAPNYMGISNVANMRKGMLAYEDVGGQFNSTDGTQAGPNGQITKNEDYVKLVNKNRTYGFTTNLGARYKSIFIKTQIATSWGGYRAIDVVKQGTSSSHNMWARETFWNDMYADDNVNGRYPNLANQDYIAVPSDFWQLDTFRCTVRNLTLGFDMPKELLEKIKIAKWSVGVTGNNLWDLYNPYPNHYRNMYDSSSENYPTLRTWAVTLNITF
ncbi:MULTISPECIES: SusC/RagA family TonB-linked outer membrane protein [Flavobacterium]|uniref:SusC/RagA family TonB-linked outer membrane protein n=1 Tax=Flavobacterium endoglycinae TaxID=2816357 RepID=A0ABX7QE70_9FLAO|nr:MULTISPECIES: SusC/RagA family TonB-linked outer membrane protein [Flavobacterium]QSW88706.1 SusC/RagA family TonB-linked outer membrane protein [Flavobacterium endoglycinae]